MSELLVLLSHGHAGRPDGPFDLGAVSEAGAERDLTRAYMHAAELALREASVPCWTLADGTLEARQLRANAYAKSWLRKRPAGRVLYVACHLNAGGGDYGAIFVDARSRGSLALGAAIKDELLALEGLDRVFVVPSTSGDWTSAALRTIEHVWDGPDRMWAACFEPLFLDQPAHFELLRPEGLVLVGEALARGLLRAIY